jgi:IS30 family transposase
MSYAHLTPHERYQIQQGFEAGLSLRQIGAKLGRHHATIGRELNRGRSKRASYEARAAQFAAERRARRSAANHPTKPPGLRKLIKRLVRLDWSPEQAQGYLLRFEHPAASVPAIYSWVREDRRAGGLLQEHLRFGKRKHVWGRHSRGVLPSDRPSIHQRPAYVQLRRAPGHWEGDTFMGSSTSPHRTLTFVERHSRYVCVHRPPSGIEPMSVRIVPAAVAALRGLPLQSITFDNGSEFAGYKHIAKRLDCNIYFTDTHSPWQRGTCENTIGLLRQYIPKGTSGAHLSRSKLLSIQNKLNHRPRKCLGFRTPAEVLLQADPPVALRP